MTTKLLIDRELLERVAKPVLFRSDEDAHADACAELRAILAAPVQAELTNVRCNCAREYPHDCNVSYSNSSRPLAEQGERQEVWARQCDLDESDPALFVSRERVEESGYTVRLTTATQPSQDVRALLSADDVRDACANAVSVFAEEANADQCREVAEYMREVLLADLERAAPRQPEGDGLEVVESLHVWRATNRFGDTCHFGDAGCARVWAGAGGKVDRIELKPVPELYDVKNADAGEVSAGVIEVVAWRHCADATRLLCDLGKQRSVPGHYADEFTIPLCRLSDAQRAIAELRADLEGEREQARDFQQEHYELQAERDTLRQQLAELRAQLLAIASAEPRRHTIEWAKAMAATGNNEAYAKWREAFDQRDRLAGLLADVKADYTHAIHWEDMHATMKRIDAALAEVKPCQESPAPTT